MTYVPVNRTAVAHPKPPELFSDELVKLIDAGEPPVKTPAADPVA
jgi:hypothetical protein